jgi:dipeptidyl-peptidase 4
MLRRFISIHSPASLCPLAAFACLALLASTLRPTVSSVAWAESPRIELTDEAPSLSLESLYHPKDRYSYLPSPTPAMRWLKGDDDHPLLLVRRAEGWMQIDPQGGDEQPAEPERVLIEQIASLEGVESDQAKQVAQGWLSNPNQSLESGLAFIGDAIAIVGTKEQARWVTRDAKSWQEISLSPDSKKIAYIESNDLYVKAIETGQVIRITDDGSAERLNGKLDWVYQEELYGRGNFRGYWWRDDSAALAFLRLDTSRVGTFTYTGSQTPRGEVVAQRYPKAGDPNPVVSLWAVKLCDGQSDSTVMPIQLLDALNDKEALITRVGWQKDSEYLFAQVASRVQNVMSVYRIDLEEPSKPLRLVHEQCDKWLEVQELPHVLESGDYLRLSDLPTGRRRLWRLSQDGSMRTPLTPEDFDVRELVHVDAESRYALVTGDIERGTAGQQLYRVDLREASELVRLTDAQPWHVASISHDGRWMIDRASSLEMPVTTWLRPLDDLSQENKPDETARARQLHQEKLRISKPLFEVEWPEIKTPDGLTLQAYVIRPKADSANNAEAASKPAPVLIEIYGGPLSPTVRDAWAGSRTLFHQMLAENGIAVMVVDNRSSGGRGLADSWSIHQRVGEVETQDLVTIADWLGEQPWADAKRLALRGWSFGGFLTLHSMTHSDRFAVGIAGGSVTDWRNYDTIYTERYMGLPEQNSAGYDSTSPLRAASKLHGRVLLLHGEMDDNVHLANMLQMAGELQKAGKPFEMMVYPTAGHGIYDSRQNYHLMKTTLEFLRREFGLPAE